MFIQSLRASTANCHQQLELNDLSQALLSSNVNQPIYCNYLSHLYKFVYGFEQFVYPKLSAHFSNISERKKASLIETDLIEFHHSSKDIFTLPEAFFNETYPDIYTASGALYVLEGSTLGGQIIVKHLHKTLPPGFDGSTYFSAYKQKTGSMWKEFLVQLTNLPTSHFEEQQIINGAVKTFDIINNILSNIPQKYTSHEYKEYSK